MPKFLVECAYVFVIEAENEEEAEEVGWDHIVKGPDEEWEIPQTVDVSRPTMGEDDA